jgi:hypothetical protein
MIYNVNVLVVRDVEKCFKSRERERERERESALVQNTKWCVDGQRFKW